MSGIKTHIIPAFLISLQLAASPAVASTTQFSDPTRQFATCAGRMFALLEHHWLISPEKADETQAVHAHFADLIDATMTPDRSSEILATRVEARISFRKMLEASRFNTKTDQQIWAQQRVDHLISECRSMLLS